MTETRTKDTAVSGGQAPDALPAESGNGESATALRHALDRLLACLRVETQKVLVPTVDGASRWIGATNETRRFVSVPDMARFLEAYDHACAVSARRDTELLQPPPNTTAEGDNQ